MSNMSELMSELISHNGVKYAWKYIVCFNYLILYALCTEFLNGGCPICLNGSIWRLVENIRRRNEALH